MRLLVLQQFEIEVNGLKSECVQDKTEQSARGVSCHFVQVFTTAGQKQINGTIYLFTNVCRIISILRTQVDGYHKYSNP